jgi:hypothetical protein
MRHILPQLLLLMNGHCLTARQKAAYPLSLCEGG